MASTVAANIQRLRASQHFHHEAPAVPGNGVGRDDDDDGDDDVVEGDEDGDEDGSFVDRDEDRKCDSPISESEPEAASQDWPSKSILKSQNERSKNCLKMKALLKEVSKISVQVA